MYPIGTLVTEKSGLFAGVPQEVTGSILLPNQYLDPLYTHFLEGIGYRVLDIDNIEKV